MERNVGFDENSFSVLRKYEDWHWWFQYRNEMIVWMMKKFGKSSDEILEIGCGNGLVTGAIQRAFPKADITATEFLEGGVLHARARLSDVTFRQLDARDLSEDEAFDAVCAFDVLEHIDADVEVMTAIRKAMRDSQSRFYITVPQHMSLWSQADEAAKHERRYSLKEMQEKLLQSGFEIEYKTSYVFLMFPLMYASRLLNRSQAEYDSESEFKVSRFGNQLIGGIMRFEAILRNVGLPMPFGGSLVVVAKPI